MIKKIHIGYPKAASKFIQKELIAKSPASGHVLSNETFSMGYFKPTLDEELLRKYPKPEICARELYEKYPNADILIIQRDIGSWLESLWKHVNRSPTAYGTMTLGQLVKTKYFEKQILKYLNIDYVVNTYKQYFKNVYIVRFELLQSNPELFIDKVCNILEIQPNGYYINRQVNLNKSHLYCIFRMYMHRLYRLIPYRTKNFDDKYVKFEKRYVGKLDSIFRRIEKLYKIINSRFSHTEY